jgi:hypothetical protein
VYWYTLFVVWDSGPQHCLLHAVRFILTVLVSLGGFQIDIIIICVRLTSLGETDEPGGVGKGRFTHNVHSSPS